MCSMPQQVRACAPPARRRGVGRRPRHRRPPVGAGEAQRAAAGGTIRSRGSSARWSCRRSSGNALFLSAALPLHVFPPLFNRYAGGQAFGTHVDNAIRQCRGSRTRMRTDLSATLFLCEPEDYDGGELVIEDTYGAHRVKLPAGDMVLYPASSLHRVAPVTRGARVASFFWIQSMVRDDGAAHACCTTSTCAIQQRGAAAARQPARCS